MNVGRRSDDEVRTTTKCWLRLTKWLLPPWRRSTRREKDIALAPSPSCPRGPAEGEWQYAPRAVSLRSTGTPPAGSAAHQLTLSSNSFAAAVHGSRSFDNHERCVCSLLRRS